MNRNDYRDFVQYLEGNTEKFSKEQLNILKRVTKNYEIKLGNLFRKNKDGKLLRVLKDDDIDTVLFMIHNHPTGGHFGKEAVYNKLVERYYWKGISRDIEEYIKRCDVCQRRG